MSEYAAFLVKIWHLSEQAGARIVLENIHTGERHQLDSAEVLLRHLMHTGDDDVKSAATCTADGRNVPLS